MNLARRAVSKFRLSLFALAWVGNLILLLLGFAWLQIPDSHAWEFALSILSAFALVVAFCWLHVTTFVRLRNIGEPGPLWTRILAFAVLFTVWLFLARWIASGDNSAWTYAQYWNSKLSAGHRVVFTPPRIVAALSWALLLAQLLLAGILIPLAMELGTRSIRGISFAALVRASKNPLLWLVVFASGLCAVEGTTALVNWIPGRGVAWETFSVLARLLAAWTLDVFLWLVVLATVAAALSPEPTTT